MNSTHCGHGTSLGGLSREILHARVAIVGGEPQHRATYRREHGLWLGQCLACGYCTQQSEARSHARSAFRAHITDKRQAAPEGAEPERAEEEIDVRDDPAVNGAVGPDGLALFTDCSS